MAIGITGAIGVGIKVGTTDVDCSNDTQLLNRNIKTLNESKCLLLKIHTFVNHVENVPLT